MALGRATTTNNSRNKKNTTTQVNKTSTTSTVGARPYSSPNASTTNTKPVTTTANKSTTVNNTGRNTVTTNPATKAVNTNDVRNTAPVTTVNKAVTTPQTQNVAPVTYENKATNPTPTVNYNPVQSVTPAKNTTPVDTQHITPQTNTFSDILNQAIDPLDLLPTSASELLTVQANEAPEQKTNRWMGLLGSLTGVGGPGSVLGATGLAAANSLFNDNGLGKATNYNAARNSMGMEITDADRKKNLAEDDLISTLMGADAVRPYSNPNYAFDTSNGNSSLYGNTNTNNSEESNVYRRGDGLGTGPVGTGSIGIGEVDSLGLDALYDLLNAQLAEYDNQYNSLMENLLAAYGMNNDNLDAYYQQVLNALGNNYADTQDLLRAQLGNSQQALEDDRRKALQEAYISRMMAQKQLADQLDAYGLTGGASESVMANLLNNYMNNRASVEEKTQTSLKDLLQNYLSNVSNARQSYNQSLMNAEQNRLNARQNYANNLAESQASAANYLANARSGAYENLFNTLAKLALQ